MSDAAVLERPTSADDASELAEALSRGAQLEPLRVYGVPLAPNERAYAEVDVEAWRLLATEPVYERRSVIFGGPAVTLATSLACAVANRRRRLEAERAAQPQWRSLGVVRVVATDRRLLVWHVDRWWPVPFGDVHGWDIESSGEAFTVTLREGAPYRFARGGTPLLSLVILWLSVPGRPAPR